MSKTKTPSTRVVEVSQLLDKQAFNRLAPHPVQSWEWGEFRKREGHQVIRLGEYQNHRLKAVFQVSFHKIPQSSFCIGYLPKTTLPSTKIIGKLKEIGREKKAIFIKIEPHVISSENSENKLKKLGLRKVKSFFAKYTSLVDLAPSEEEILKSFKPKTRYNIRLAQKHGVTVKENNSTEAFEKYLQLTTETTQRQGFFAHDPNYHRQQWTVLKPAGISHLLTAEYQGKILATFILFVFNQVLYYPYGASSREHKEVMAPTLLMWEAIRFGKKHHCQHFDLWGDAEPNPSPNHPYYGFHKFKEGFSPKLVEFVGTYDLVVNPWLYWPYRFVNFLRWKFLRLKTKIPL